jgi:anti-sigma regulatory factor (Ser/Thr protein kinase)
MPVAADPAGLAVVRTRLRSWLGGLGAPHELMASVLLAAEEAVNNAIEHGDTASSGRHGPPITLTACRAGDHIDVAVTDPGPWRPSRPSPNPGRGRGLELMEAMMTSVSVEAGAEGTTVTMRVGLASDEGPGTGERGAPR